MIKRLVLVVATSFFLLIFGAQAVSAYDPLCTQRDASGVCTEGPCSSANSSQSPTCNQDQQQQTSSDNSNPIAGPNGTLHQVSNIMALLSGVVAVIIIIFSGIRYITSAGNPERTKKAKGTLVDALIGLVVVALAWSFVTFVVDKFVG